METKRSRQPGGTGPFLFDFGTKHNLQNYLKRENQAEVNQVTATPLGGPGSRASPGRSTTAAAHSEELVWGQHRGGAEGAVALRPVWSGDGTCFLVQEKGRKPEAESDTPAKPGSTLSVSEGSQELGRRWCGGGPRGPERPFHQRKKLPERVEASKAGRRRPTSGPVGGRRTRRHLGLDQNSADGTSFSHASPRCTENSNWSLTGPAGSLPGLESGEQGPHCQRAGRQRTDGSGPAA